jgi:hypothetical protein
MAYPTLLRPGRTAICTENGFVLMFHWNACGTLSNRDLSNWHDAFQLVTATNALAVYAGRVPTAVPRHPLISLNFTR